MTLQQMKEKIDEAKTQKAKYEGELDSIKRRLKSEFSLDSVEDAEKKVEELESEIAEQKKTFDSKMDALQNDYNWD